MYSTQFSLQCLYKEIFLFYSFLFFSGLILISSALLFSSSLFFFKLQGGDVEKEAAVSALLEQTAPYMPAKKIMDPSRSKSNITTSTLIQTNNKKNPSSSNKNVIVNANTISTKLSAKVTKPKGPKNPAQNITVNVVVKKQKKIPSKAPVILLDANGVEIPKLSRRLQIQQRVEKKMSKAAAAGGGVDATSTSTSTSSSVVGSVNASPSVTTSTPVSAAAKPVTKANTNMKANRPSGTSVEGPNSGKKWVRREQDVTTSASSTRSGAVGVVDVQSSRFTEPVGTYLQLMIIYPLIDLIVMCVY